VSASEIEHAPLPAARISHPPGHRGGG
jgi:hypothetical protein